MTPIMLFSLASVVAAVVGASLFLMGRRQGVRAVRRIGLAWLAYAAYELAVQVVTPEASIRADLLLFYPVLLLGLTWALIALARHGKQVPPAS